MKKLVVAAMIVCVAAVSQAASFNWGASGVMNENGTALYSGDAILTAYTLAGVEVATFNGTMTDGAISQVISDDKLASGTNYKFSYTMTTATAEFTSTTVMGRGQATSTPALNFTSGGSWTAAAPEPTSALLMLLGMAGLALKRTRA